MSKINALVTGAGGFLGHHLVKYLVRGGYHVRGVDVKLPEYELSAAHEFLTLDLRQVSACDEAVRDIDEVYHLAADMGGIGYITSVHADVARNNVLIDSNMLEASADVGVRRFFYSSSACVYPVERQGWVGAKPLAEWEAYPANPEPAYGWEKLFAEELCKYYWEDKKLSTRIARFHNIYGPCFDERTEILTLGGWKKFSQLSYDDLIATKNPVSGELEYQRPSEIQSYDYFGPMYELRSRNTDLLITPDHKIYYAVATTTKRHVRVVSDFRLGAVALSKWDRASMYFSCGVAWSGIGIDPEFFSLPEVVMTDGRKLK